MKFKQRGSNTVQLDSEVEAIATYSKDFPFELHLHIRKISSNA